MKNMVQGDLDGLCGCYSAINSVRYIKRISIDECVGLFHQCLRLLEQDKKLSEIVTQGTTIPLIIRIFREIIDPKYQIKRMRPFHNKKGVPLGLYWDCLKAFLDEPRRNAVFIGVDDDYSGGHWTLIVKATDKALYQYDSYHGKKLLRRRITTQRITLNRPYLVSPSYTMFLG